MYITIINTEIHEYGQFKAHMIIGYENGIMKSVYVSHKFPEEY